MTDYMRYLRGDIHRDEGTLRMDTHPQLTNGQVLSLPDGTEMIVINIAMMGMGLSLAGYTIDAAFREGLFNPEMHEGCDHGMSRAEIEESLFPGSVFITLLPEGYAPDPSEFLNEKFVRKGYKDGLEGGPQFSAEGLRARFPDEWTDESYAAYLTAYKRGVESRKKGN